MYFLPHITNSGGMERIVIDKINYLAQKGHMVYLAYFGNETDNTFYHLDDKVCKCPIQFDTNKVSFTKRIFFALGIVGKIKHTITCNGIDVVVNANTPLVSWILPFICRKTPKIIELHFSYEGLKIMNKKMYGSNFLKSSFNQMLRHMMFPLYNVCVLLTEDDKRAWHLKNSVVISNFTNLDNSCKSEMNYTKAVSVGRLTFQKNMDILVDAWKYVHQENPEWTLDIWGDGEERCLLERKIKENGLGNVVFLRGTSKCIECEYPKYSLFVLPSRYEGFPLVLVEAMQFGLPCIGFEIPGNTAVIKDGNNGHIVKKRDAISLANVICETIRNKTTLKRMALNASDSIQVFNKDKVMQQWIDLFNRVVKI